MSIPGHILSSEMDLFLREQPMTDAQVQPLLATLNIPFNNYYATTAPAVTDDSSDGYSVGSKWYNSVTKETYVCSNAAVGAAVWVDATLIASELGSAAFANTTAFAASVHTHAAADIVSVTSQRLIGRHAGTNGAGQEVSVGNGLEFQDSGIRRSALTGDVTASAGSNTTTIANDAVTNAKLANMATARIKGRTTAGDGDPEDLTAEQARTVLGLGTAATANTTAFASALGTDDNYVTDAEKTVIGNTSGTNTGDQDLSGYALTSSLATVATSGDYDDLSNLPDLGTAAFSNVEDFAAATHASTHLPAGPDELFDQSLNSTDSPTFEDLTLTGTMDVLPFNTTNGAPENLGELAWSQDEETLSLMLKGGTVLQLGEETLYHVENNTGTTIAKGAPVMYAGTVGNSGKLRVKPWDGTDPKAFMGIATMAITGAEGTGYVTHFGKLQGIQTNGANYGQSWVSGNIIYAVTGSANLTNVAPSAGGHVVVAVVIAAHASNGTLFVRPTQVPTASEIGAQPAGSYVAEGDPRLNDARTPTAHASTHAPDGSDPITPAAIGAETPDGAAAQIAAAELTSAQIMSKAGERLIASLAAVRGASNAGTCYFATTRSTSGTFTVKTSTGYARLVNSDNTLGAQAGTGDVANPITLTIPASGLHRALGIISVPFDGTSHSGNITEITLRNNQLTTFSGTGLSALTRLILDNNQLTTFSGTGLSSLTTLYLYGNQLTTFSGTGLSSLTTLYLYDNQLTTFSGTGMGALTTLWLYNNQLTTFSGTGLSALTALDLANNQLTSYTNHPPLIGSVGGLIMLNLFNNALNASQIDAAFNALYQPPRWSGTMLSVIVTSGGTNAAPTAASLTARDAYTTAGWILLTN